MKASTLQAANWQGSIPVHLTLAPTSLSSATVPPTLHRLVPRATFLHVALRDEIRRLHRSAPVVLMGSVGGGVLIRSAPPDEDNEINVNASSHSRSRARSGSNASADQLQSSRARSRSTSAASESESISKQRADDGAETGGKKESSSKGDGSSLTSPMPVCWFEDEATGLALRWHLFAGTLFDLSRQRSGTSTITSSSNSNDTMILPWKILVHFTSYPSNQILSFDTHFDGSGVMQSIERHYMNSLKQALFLQHGSSRVAMNICKADHRKLWDAIVASSYNLYGEVNQELQAEIRDASNGEDHSAGQGESCNFEVQNIPVRVLVDRKPAIQRLCPPFRSDKNGDDEDLSSKESIALKAVTLGDVLVKFAPKLFEIRKNIPNESEQNERKEEKKFESEDTCTDSIVPLEDLTWIIQGLNDIPLSFPIGQVWSSLSSPDHFLYISILIK